MKPRPQALRNRTKISKSFLADVAGKGGAALRPLVSAVLARGVLAEIPQFFWSVRPTIGIQGNSNAVVFWEIGVD